MCFPSAIYVGKERPRYHQVRVLFFRVICCPVKTRVYSDIAVDQFRLAMSARETEVDRRIKLNECMVKFLDCLQKLFQAIAKEDGEKINIFRPLKSLEQEVKKAVKSPADGALQDAEKHIAKIVLSIDDSTQPSFDLDGNSWSVMAAKVLEWKDTLSPLSVADRWRFALAVVTVDSYLHLFDLTPFLSNDDIYLGCSPNIAMGYLFPLLKPSRADGGYNGNFISFRDKMIPEFSMILSKDCSVEMLHDECCEIAKLAPQGVAGRWLGMQQEALSRAQLRILSWNAGSGSVDRFFAILKELTTELQDKS